MRLIRLRPAYQSVAVRQNVDVGLARAHLRRRLVETAAFCRTDDENTEGLIDIYAVRPKGSASIAALARMHENKQEILEKLLFSSFLFNDKLA